MRTHLLPLLLAALFLGLWSLPTRAQLDLQRGDEWGWMYLTITEGEYTCHETWTDGAQTLHLVVESPVWGPGDAYNGVEFGIDYPETVFNTGFTQNSPYGGVVFGGCSTPGRCSFRAGSGGPVASNPWTAMDVDFLAFGVGDNVLFRMTAPDVASLHDRPAWLYYDAFDPPVILTEPTDCDGGRPGWHWAFVIFNYVPVPGDEFLDSDPCAAACPTPTAPTSWGTWKAGWGPR